MANMEQRERGMTGHKNSTPCTREVNRGEDRDLVGRIKSRDEAALALMMEKYSGRVYATAFRVLRRRPEAQEVTQDVFFALWKSPDRFDDTRGPLITWLVILSRSRAIDLLRRLEAHTRRIDELHQESPIRRTVTVPSNYDRTILVKELLAGLPREQASLVRKVYLEGRAMGEVAAVQGKPLGTIKGRARFALKSLRSALGSK
jgi:RNA polymerase sigma-70 factor, ECF subfamily